LTDHKPLILISNDDGIKSPGLAAAAAALAPLGELLIVAPHVQQSGMGRAMPGTNDGRLFETYISLNSHRWQAYGAVASPPQAVQHGLLELATRRPALCVSGINYGENVGTAVTISGTVGAALEAAAHGIPAIAVSLQVDFHQHHTLDDTVDFSGAQYWLRYFAERMLALDMPEDVDVLKIDVPAGATPDTPWRITRLERQPYFRPLAPERTEFSEAGPIGYELASMDNLEEGTDAHAIVEGVVSVTPLSLDMTSRVEQELLRELLEDKVHTAKG